MDEICECEYPDESFDGSFCESCGLDMPDGTIDATDANVHLLRIIGEI